MNSLHVAMVVRCFSEKGGLELYAHRTIEGLLKRGHSVTVLCEEKESDYVHPKLTIKFFEHANKKDRKAVRIKHHFKAASEAIRMHGPFDIVHSQHLPMAGADIVSFHNHTANRLAEVGQPWEKLLSNLKMFYSLAYKRRFEQDQILCQSPVLMFSAAVLKDDFRKVYDLDKTHSQSSYVVAFPGANFPKDNLVEQSSGDSKSKIEPFTFLFVGKGFRKKGLDILFAACKDLKSRLQNENLEFRLLIAGLKQKPIDTFRLQNLGLTKIVKYLGFRKDMQNVFAQAKVIVLPSRIEPFGMAPVQGMLEGLVPIVSAVAGVSEALNSETDALILKDHLDARELSSLMERIMKEPLLLQKLSQNARQTATLLTWDETVNATERGYAEVLAQKKI